LYAALRAISAPCSGALLVNITSSIEEGSGWSISILLAYYENEPDVSEALLLRVLKPTKLPTDSDIISSMVEYYKDNLRTTGSDNQLDSFTRYEFGFSGLECRTLGTFYKEEDGRLYFGADVGNFYRRGHE
jgi:hypothetical protein